MAKYLSYSGLGTLWAKIKDTSNLNELTITEIITKI